MPRQAGFHEKFAATQACSSTARWSFPWRVPPLPCHHDSARIEPLPSHANLAQNISVFELPSASSSTSHRRPPPSDVSAAKGGGQRDGAHADHIDQLHSEAEKFLHGRQLVKSRPFDTECVNVTARSFSTTRYTGTYPTKWSEAIRSALTPKAELRPFDLLSGARTGRSGISTGRYSSDRRTLRRVDGPRKPWRPAS